MRIDVITLFPEKIASLVSFGVTGRALERDIVTLHTWNVRDYTQDVHRTVDDRPFGGGPGMVMKVEPLRAAIRDVRDKSKHAKVIYLSPQGKRLEQADVIALSKEDGIILIAGRYEGIDERLIESDIDEELSIGDYILSGGELAAGVLIDAVTRLLPGTLGDAQSAEQDSFMNGLLDCPHYTRPEVIDERSVPAILMSGDHQAIARWRRKQSLGRTWERRRDILEKLELNKEDLELLNEYLSDNGKNKEH